MERRDTLYDYRKTEAVSGKRQMPVWMKQVDWRAVGREIDKNCIVPSRSLSEIRKELGIQENSKKKQLIR